MEEEKVEEEPVIEEPIDIDTYTEEEEKVRESKTKSKGGWANLEHAWGNQPV